ncbi:MAG: ABC-F family ATP-binding cassette domain-containing protein [Desulfovibrio sp.]|jgi:ATP-binding cassette subfamily F protein 3|nr:ABC-F family ATP-binding cassette domain-containing protein [Desulfovibrio sp.]
MNVTLQNLSKSFGDRNIVSDFSLEVQSGVRLCVCGPNGSGKSTFLRILAGKESPDAGKILLPRESRLGYVEQELDDGQLNEHLLHFVLDVLPDWNAFWNEWEAAAVTRNQAAIAALSARQTALEQKYGYNPEHRAKGVLSGLGFAEHRWHMPLRELSGGWRERAKLARVLTAGADVLLLDEPTNHLDLEAVEWLEDFLLDYRGVLIFVVHDRVFMDKVGSHILYFSGNGKPLFRKGSFSMFVSMQEELEEQRIREAARVQDEIERKMVFIRRFKAKASKARQAASRQKMAKKLEKELENLQAGPKRKELDFSWPVPPQSDRTVLAAVDLRFVFPDGRRMWDALSFTVYRGQKIALVGPNGCGKSTLLKLLTGRSERESGQVFMGQRVRLGYFSQHQLETLNPSGSVLGEIRRLSDPRVTEEELMTVLGLFLLGQEYFDRAAGSLSGGEKSRLLLSVLFLARCNFLILDEPTNHLDLESREALVEALASYQGTLLMVAHDRRLINEAADQVWALSPEGLAVYERGFEAYTESRKKTRLREDSPALAREYGENDRVAALSREELKRLKRKRAETRNALYRQMKPLQDAYAGLEAELSAVLEEQSAVESLLADPQVYADSSRSAALLKKFSSLQKEGDFLIERLTEAEAALIPYEAQKMALADNDDA